MSFGPVSDTLVNRNRLSKEFEEEEAADEDVFHQRIIARVMYEVYNHDPHDAQPPESPDSDLVALPPGSTRDADLKRKGYSVLEAKDAGGYSVAYRLPESVRRAKVLRRYMDEVQDKDGQSLAVALRLQGYSMSQVAAIVFENGYELPTLPPEMQKDIFCAEVAMDVKRLSNYGRRMLDVDFYRMMNAYESAVREQDEKRSFFEYLESRKRGLGSILAPLYLRGKDISPSNVLYLDHAVFSPPLDDTQCRDIMEGRTAPRLYDYYKHQKFIVEDVRNEVLQNACYSHVAKPGPYQKEEEDWTEHDAIIANKYEKWAAGYALCSLVSHSESEKRKFQELADSFGNEAFRLKRSRVYDYEYPTSGVTHPDDVEVTASAKVITRVKKGLGMNLSEKEMQELSPVEREKYKLNREKKRNKKEVQADKIRLEREIIELRHSIAKHNRLIESAMNRKLRDLPNVDPRSGGTRIEEDADDTIKRISQLRNMDENELHVKERELQSLQSVTASCVMGTSNILGRDEERNRLSAFLSYDRVPEGSEHLYELYIHPYEELYEDPEISAILDKYIVYDRPDEVSEQGRKIALQAVDRLVRLRKGGEAYLQELSPEDLSETRYALSAVHRLYARLKPS